MNITHKIIAFGLALAFVAPGTASAAVIDLSPATSVANKGATFSVTVSANPAVGEKAYTVRANLAFDPTLLELVSWSFAPKWIVLSQSGYDAEDNAKGILVKTAGYPGSVTSSTVLGTAVFRAKLAGTAAITAGADSLILDKANKNLLSGGPGSVRITISAVAPAPMPALPTTPASQKASTSTTTSLTGIVGGTIEGTTIATSSALGTTTQTAAVATAGAWLTENWITLLVVLIVLAGAGVWVWYRKFGNGRIPPLS